MSFLLARSWELSLKFDPWHEATYERSFSTFLYRRVYSYEVANWYRERFGDSRYEKPETLSLDHDPGGSGGLDELIPDREGDVADYRSPDLARVLDG